MNRTVSIATLGCKTNQFESAAMEERLREAGYQVIPFEEGADLVVVNTCSVTRATDSQSRNLIRRARRINLGCRVIVTGCYAQVDPEGLRTIPGVAVVLGNDEKKDLLRYIAEERDDQVVAVSDIRRAKDAVPLSLASFADRSRAFVQIQNGCDAFCSYCIIPYARGSSRSRPEEEVLEEIRKLAGKGFPEVVLTGIHIGGYGRDLEPPTTLTRLVGRIAEEIDIPRIRLGSVEPTEIPDDLIALIADAGKLCPHLHIPLQSGDNAVLKRMNRTYTADFFFDLVERIHRQLPEAAIGIDVIAGFPGETEAEFENTRRLVDALPVTHLHVFPYSRRPGTPAAARSDQLTGDVIRERAGILRMLGEEKTRRFAERFVGRLLEVVVEGGDHDGWCRGLSRNYLTILFRTKKPLTGRRVFVKVTEWTPDGLHGTLV